MAITPYTISLDPKPSATRNVADRYREMTTAEIRADLDSPGKRSPLVQVALNWSGDFNKATLIRTNNAMLGREVYIVGKRHYDRRGTVGTHQYEHVFHAETLREVADHLHAQGYTLYAMDNIPEVSPRPLMLEELPERTAFVYGEEGTGIPPECYEEGLFDAALYIPQRGSVRSLNVGTAGAIATYEYNRQHNLF